jgi:hypothetical protein
MGEIINLFNPPVGVINLGWKKSITQKGLVIGINNRVYEILSNYLCEQVFRECLISSALISMGNNWRRLGTWPIHFFQDINIKL